MVQVIGQGRVKPKSFSQQIGEGVSRLAQGASNYGFEQQELETKNRLMQQREMKENQQLKQLTGIDFEGLSPEIKKSYLSELMKGQSQENLANIKGQFGIESKKLGLENKAPSGGLSGQSVPPEVSMAANKVIQQFPDVSADQLKMMMDEIGIPPAYSNGYVENRRRQDERAAASKDKRLESGQKRAEKVLDKADRIGENIPLKESYVNAMEDAVVNEDLGFWSADNLATMTGIEGLRSAKGAQFISAAKNYFIDDLKASGARPNMFIEKQLVDSLAKIGRSQEANQVVLESFKFKNDLDKNWLETVRSLEKQYDETLGYLPGSLSRIAEEMNKPYVEERQKQYESRLKELAIQEKTKSKKSSNKKESKPMIVDVVGPDGKVYEINSDEVELLPEGYRLQ